MPSGVIAIIVGLISAWIAAKSNQHLLTLMGFLLFGVIGEALMAFLPASNKAGRMVGNYLTNIVLSKLRRIMG
jgi:hypothetical protein